jgi:protein SCO1
MNCDVRRRRVLQAVLALGLVPGLSLRASPPTEADRIAAARSSHFPFGAVVPARPIPAWAVTTNAGVSTDLASLLRGRTTALQLMFTGCSATCPIQGALFAQAQRALTRATPDAQFISVSIAPAADTPAALQAWLSNLSAQAGWLAVRPRIEDLDALFEVLARGGEARPPGTDPHSGQVYIVNRRGELTYRTPSMPPARDIVAALGTAAG